MTVHPSQVRTHPHLCVYSGREMHYEATYSSYQNTLTITVCVFEHADVFLLISSNINTSSIIL